MHLQLRLELDGGPEFGVVVGPVVFLLLVKPIREAFGMPKIRHTQLKLKQRLGKILSSYFCFTI